jgi:hypothetical protein
MMRRLPLGVAVAAAACVAAGAQTLEPVKARVRSAKPEWTKGIQPISRESYYNAIACGKQGGQDSPCVFWDTGMCKNGEFELSFYTPYKMVAYAVWNALRQNQPQPTPDYAEAQRTRVTIAVKPLRPSKNAVKDVRIKRDEKFYLVPAARAVMPQDSRFTFDFPAWAPTTDVTLEIIGQTRPLSCIITKDVLAQMR